jgi:3-deoxy-7-phosphoheptulonate synthase
LRGGKTPNYEAVHVAAACREIEAAKLECSLMVDCSHANSSKQHERQVDVARDVAQQLKAGSRCIFGVMVESHLIAGAQKFSAGIADPSKLENGKSITDACIGWEHSLEVLDVLSDAVITRRSCVTT